MKNSRIPMTGPHRSALKSAVAAHSGAAGYLKGLNVSSVSQLTVSQLWDLADALDIDAARTFRDADQRAAQPASVLFSDADLGTEAPTPSAAPDPAAIDAATAATKTELMAAFATGDPAEFHGRVRKLVADSLKPAAVVEKVVEVPVEKIVEKIVEIERLVEVQAPPAGCRPHHMPVVVSSTKIEGVEMPVFDAPDAPTPDAEYIWPAGTSYALSKVKRGQPVFLFGPAGTGKTSWARQIAAVSKRPFVRISFHQDTSAAAIVGGRVPDGTGAFPWTDAVLLRAIRRPGTIVCLDEISAARPDAVMVLQGVLEPGGGLTVDETGEHVRVAPNVVFVMCDNTNGRGDTSGVYEGTRRMNGATLDRPTATLRIDYLEPEREAELLVAKTKIDDHTATLIAQFAALTRQEADKGLVTHGVGLRRLLAIAEGIADGAKPLDAVTYSLLQGASPEDAPRFEALWKTVVGN